MSQPVLIMHDVLTWDASVQVCLEGETAIACIWPVLKSVVGHHQVTVMLDDTSIQAYYRGY